MVSAEDIKPAQELIQVFQRARKNLRIYPVNNPVYSKTIEDAFRRADDFLEAHGDLELKFRQNEILIGDRNQTLYSADREDNFAFFFFKDGVRELSFRRGLTPDEMRDFLQAISFDFERQSEDDDIVTVLWEKDFEHIKYVVDSSFLLEDEVYENQATARAKMEPASEVDLKRIYEDMSKEEAAARQAQVIEVTKTDLLVLQKELERDLLDKLPRLVEILFELFRDSPPPEYGEIVNLINEAFEYCVKNGDLQRALGILDAARGTPEGAEDEGGLMKRELERVFEFACSAEIVGALGERLDSGEVQDPDAFDEYVRHLDKKAVPSFITILGELKTMEARRRVINALVFLGEKDIHALAKGLSDDRWYVVRNIIYIFRRIGDKRALEFLSRAAHHQDVRVRMEVLKTLGELEGQGMMSVLKESLDDPETSIRMTAVRALGRIKSPSSKRIIMERIGGKAFLDLEFNEKKECFEALANWNEPETGEFLLRALKSTSFFKRGRMDEFRACAAYALGLMRCKEALEPLEKLKGAKNGLLREYAYKAIKRIEYGQ
ncbi:MAG: HEAT repeat domain-containing protein [Nitrospiraceae bacterium]|nr:HEAT repeat domain-containing protein [Nitrospiraceae bacterium]